MPDIIAVLDFGSQYTQVIARRIREAHVLSRIYPYNTKASVLKKEGVKGIILSGGPSSVLLKASPRVGMAPIEWLSQPLDLFAKVLNKPTPQADI